jgi:hypothetical protein
MRMKNAENEGTGGRWEGVGRILFAQILNTQRCLVLAGLAARSMVSFES